ncbi:pimelyl-ACP methyl ester esterase BioV [Sulfurimonas aquatica]|uniref:Pimelyl-ACP methyl ester esterase BioV n=1 Tax=Sulfurimonas aquatica TaxID=2672570 RepID=A0A975B008_9BACT|nr:pimelyl-ACP methyl ester esterase BioV [Sulfurimonas aquatica]QSZ41697.1 pimelyl-ACP methyl ester esterase BioV [Sulfurimonas aquatica]
MKFYSGFSLKNEEYLFKEYILKSEYTIVGFSYGAIKAFNKAQKDLREGIRIDTLQLFSPAFFQTKDEKFKRLQLMSYKKNKNAYLNQFINSCFAPHKNKIIENRETSIEELKDLLEYEWPIEHLRALEDRGVKIEVYLGSEDKIIDVESAREFFLELSTVTYIKGANHFLQLS